jgi:hypothetical protein
MRPSLPSLLGEGASRTALSFHAIVPFASVVLDSSNKENACTSAHPLSKDVVYCTSFPIHTDLHVRIEKQLAVLWTGKMTPLIAIADNRDSVCYCSLHR